MVVVFSLNMEEFKAEIELEKISVYGDIKNLHTPQQKLSQFIRFFVLEEFFGKNNIELSHTNGKPYLFNNDLYFNITHTANMIFMVVADRNVGIDAESFKSRKRSAQAIADRYFSEHEASVLRKSANLSRDFYTLWTLKESEVKRSSDGIARGFKSAIFNMSEHNGWISSNYPNDFQSFYYKDFVVSLCCDKLQQSKTIQYYKITNSLKFEEITL